MRKGGGTERGLASMGASAHVRGLRVEWFTDVGEMPGAKASTSGRIQYAVVVLISAPEARALSATAHSKAP